MVAEFITESSEDLNARNQNTKDIIIDFASGIAGGHPLDTVKVRLQNQVKGEYRGIWHCLVRIVKEEKVRGLYKGMGSPLVGVALMNSLLFGVYGTAIRAFNPSGGEPSLGAIALAGSVSGFITSFVCSPMELIKIRLQNQRDLTKIPKGTPIYSGPVDCIRQIYKSQGLKGFTKGLTSTILREAPSYAAYFATYELLCRKLLPDGNYDVPSGRLLLAGGFAGVAGWVVTYPADVIKTRLQSVEQEIRPTYKGFVDCWKQIARVEGSRVLWSGLGAACVRAFPTNAATFYAVCWMKSALQ